MMRSRAASEAQREAAADPGDRPTSGGRGQKKVCARQTV